MHFICFMPLRKTSAEHMFAAAKSTIAHNDKLLHRRAQLFLVLPLFTIFRIFRKSNTLYFICKAELAIYSVKFCEEGKMEHTLWNMNFLCGVRESVSDILKIVRHLI